MRNIQLKDTEAKKQDNQLAETHQELSLLQVSSRSMVQCTILTITTLVITVLLYMFVCVCVCVCVCN